jgi:hypothetical protein
MSQFDHFRPPEHLSLSGKLAFRVLCWAVFVIAMALFAYFVVPLVAEHISKPFSEWVGTTLFGPKDVASPQ